jgi:quercetin dioxygenase-like cupin family protein
MRLEGKIKKIWGHEDIFVTNDLYCGKYLFFDKTGNKTSMHFHQKKHETWTVIEGKFLARLVMTEKGEVQEYILSVGDTLAIEPLVPHQLEAITDQCQILEISTPDSVEDNYRIYR